MDRESVLQTIPHRPPFLFVDEVVELEEQRIRTRVQADPAAEFFKGHYPDNPVMPGVLLCECCFQAGALLVGHKMRNLDSPRHAGGTATDDQGSPSTPVITRIKDAKFKQIVRPGDMLDVEVTIDENVNDVFFMTGRLRVGGKLAVRVEFAATLVRS
jgi:3-hydroxyacyl-[acyl-carrier-protein] dehydratase